MLMYNKGELPLFVTRRLNAPSRFIAIFIMITAAFLTAVSAVKMGDEGEKMRDDGESVTGSFPISVPPISFDKSSGKATVAKKKDGENCLFYAEGISVVVFTNNYQGKKQSAWADYATISGDEKEKKKEKPKYTASMKCQTDQKIGSTFEIYVKVDGDVNGFLRADLVKKDDRSKPQFIVSEAEFTLNFNFTQVGYWELTDARVKTIKIKKDGDFLKNDLQVDSGWELELSSIASSNINGFKDYSFACGRTNPVVWTEGKDKKKDKDFAVGITLNNVQFQPFNATYKEGQKEMEFLKFGRKVNDCQGLFNIGTWMGLIVTLLLTGVLFFGFLMLNSVQTMDRFDDPKQKQLIINAKE